MVVSHSRGARLCYISWQDDEANLAQLRANRQAHGEDRRHGPPREGPARLARAVNLWVLRQPDDGSLPRCEVRPAPLPRIPLGDKSVLKEVRTNTASVSLELV
jgi:hypothetical protein